MLHVLHEEYRKNKQSKNMPGPVVLKTFTWIWRTQSKDRVNKKIKETKIENIQLKIGFITMTSKLD